jgi:hypothetical protein
VRRLALVVMLLLGVTADAEAGWRARRSRNDAFARLLRDHPAIGWPIVIGVVALSIVSRSHRRSQRFESRAGGAARWTPPTHARRHELLGPRPEDGTAPEQLARFEPAATPAAVTELLTRLLVRYHEALGAGEAGPESLRAWAAPRVVDQLRQAGAEQRRLGKRVVEVIVERLEVTDARAPREGNATLTARARVRYGVAEGAGRARGYISNEVWRLDRAPGARWPSPEVARALGCPSCAAALTTQGPRCASCGADLTAGKVTWRVSAVSVLERRPAPAPGALPLR